MRTLLILAMLGAAATVRADDADWKLVENSRADEPRIKAFSMDKAVGFLDRAGVEWTRKQSCFSCHSNLSFLYARPMISAKAPAHDEVRAAIEKLVTVRWKEMKPRWDAEVVTVAAALAHNDARTTGKLHPTTKIALDRMWTVQRPDGGWNWIHCKWPPYEIDDHYGVTLAALALGVAPEGYAKTDAAQAGLRKMKAFFKKNAPRDAHHKAMLLWAGSYVPELITVDEKVAWTKEIRGLQHKDGGWSAGDLTPWPRDDDAKPSPETSDGFGTGFAVFVLRRTGVAVSDTTVSRGQAWLRDNQRESGRWYTRSLLRDSKHYLSHAGTAFAVMALAEAP
jgi:squalene-hopene/tetraprenyl-beta-curcumene cyclase